MPCEPSFAALGRSAVVFFDPQPLEPIMPKLTNAQLLANLEATHVAYQQLDARHEALKAERLALQAECAALKAQRSAAPQPNRKVRPAWVPSAEQQSAHDSYVRALIAAREEAARTGKSVCVVR